MQFFNFSDDIIILYIDDGIKSEELLQIIFQMSSFYLQVNFLKNI